jgi:beta-glucosidase
LGEKDIVPLILYLDGEVIAKWNTEHHPHMEYEVVTLEEGKPYELKIEYRQWEVEYPTMKLLWDAPGDDMLADAMKIARESEVIILCMGLSPYLEGEEMKVKVDGFAGGDRVEIKLPDAQLNLMKEIMKLNKPTVLVLLNGSAIAINWENDNISLPSSRHGIPDKPVVLPLPIFCLVITTHPDVCR